MGLALGSASSPNTVSPTPVVPLHAAPLASLPTSTVPNRISERIKNGEYINFDELLPEALGATPPPVQLQLSTSSPGQLVQLVSDPHPTSVRRRVHDLATWLEAWTAYLNILLLSAPQRSSELLGYQAIIVDANKKFYPDAWLAYDRQFRTACAADFTRRWNIIDPNMWQLTMTGKARPPCSSCFIVHPLDAKGRCPFRPFHQNFHSQEPFYKGREICRNFNMRQCNLTQCPRAHVCLRCRGDHTSTTCSQPASKRPRQSGRTVTVTRQS